MSSIILIAYFWVSWTFFVVIWPAWVIRCACVYDATGTLFSWKTLQVTVIPIIITLFALEPPSSLSLAFLYVFLVFIAAIITL